MRIFLLLFIALLVLMLAGCDSQVGGPLPVLELDVLPPQDVPPVVDMGEIVSADPRGGTDVTMIRVLIGTSGFASRVHERVYVTSDGDFMVWTKVGEPVQQMRAGEVFEIRRAADLLGHEQLVFAPHHADARLEIVGLRRNWPDGRTPQYRGVLEVSATAGGFLVINELPLEEYLYAVVPSEMPSGWGLEASMVQAITARSFAYRQFYENRFRAYGAHIDDSVISQVYNNLPETDTAREAVRATRGMVLTYNGQVIVANYFSASGGTTANAGEVWSAGGVFPGESPPFLRARAQFEPGFATGDLRCEENAAAFFRNTDVPAFERDVPWFRWQVRMTAAELNAAVSSTGIGALQYLEVLARGEGGNILEMRLIGTRGEHRVQTEFNIRTLLAPRNSPVRLNNGQTLNGWSMMPSAFFTMDIQRDALGGLVGVTFYGGGHGHGAGMSQHGARALLQRGYTYREVLAHFYPNTEITLR